MEHVTNDLLDFETGRFLIISSKIKKGLINSEVIMSENLMPLYFDKNQPIEKRIEDLVSRMTLDEKNSTTWKLLDL